MADHRTSDELSGQWVNPQDILSLLLLIGGDIVQKAVAQLVGYRVRLLARHSLSIAPVAFSFGWVAYGFSNLLSAVGDKKLMPDTDCPSMLVNCSNGFARENRSWALGRVLRDHESRHEIDAKSEEEGGSSESLRIDIFTLGPAGGLHRDLVWWSGWAVILCQIGIAVPHWVLYGNWGAMMVAFCGNLLAAVTCALPQWSQEKWAGRLLTSDKVTCLTRGNGHQHIMVFIGSEGSWDLESLATASSVPRPETRWVSLVLAVLWTGLLISVSGLKANAWVFVGMGGIGMLQNVYAAGSSREPRALGFHITPFARAPTIIGRRQRYQDDDDASVNLDEDLQRLGDLAAWAPEKRRLQNPATAVSPPKNAGAMPQWLISMSKDDGVPEWLEPIELTRPETIAADAKPGVGGRVFPGEKRYRTDVVFAAGVHGALMELEKWVPSAGIAMVQIFFPSGLKYNDQSIRDNVHKKFWKRAYHTMALRKRAAELKRAAERKGQVSTANKGSAVSVGQDKAPTQAAV